MLMSPDMEYPLLCVGVRRGYSSELRLDVVRLTATEAFLDDGSVPEDDDGWLICLLPIRLIVGHVFFLFVKDWLLFCRRGRCSMW